MAQSTGKPLLLRLVKIQLMLLLVLGVVGCGQDPVAALEEMGASIDKDDDGRVLGVYVADPDFTDDGIVYLKGLSGLRQLDLTYTPVTGAGVEDLKNSLPLCNIIN